MNKVETYSTRADAEIQVNKMLASWPKAHAKQVDDYWIITVHAPDCSCGRCPVVRTDGVVRIITENFVD